MWLERQCENLVQYRKNVDIFLEIFLETMRVQGKVIRLVYGNCVKRGRSQGKLNLKEKMKVSESQIS